MAMLGISSDKSAKTIIFSLVDGKLGDLETPSNEQAGEFLAAVTSKFKVDSKEQLDQLRQNFSGSGHSSIIDDVLKSKWHKFEMYELVMNKL